MMRPATAIGVVIATVAILMLFAVDARARGYKIKDLDPTNKNSDIRKAGRDLDKNVRRAARDAEVDVGRELRNGRGAIVGSLESTWGEAGRVALPAAAGIMATRHARRPHEALPRHDRAALRAHFGNLVDRVTVLWGADPLDRWGNRRPFVVNLDDTAGQTYGRTIYIRYGKGDLSDYNRLRLLFHEMIHVQQYQKYGSISNFGYHYFRGFAKAKFSYANNPLEREAQNEEKSSAYNRVWSAYQRRMKEIAQQRRIAEQRRVFDLQRRNETERQRQIAARQQQARPSYDHRIDQRSGWIFKGTFVNGQLVSERAVGQARAQRFNDGLVYWTAQGLRPVLAR